MSLFAYHVALFRCVRGRDAFEAAAERLRHSLQGKLPGASLEYGRNNNAEGLDHGYTHAVVMCGEKVRATHLGLAPHYLLSFPIPPAISSPLQAPSCSPPPSSPALVVMSASLFLILSGSATKAHSSLRPLR